MHHYPQLNKLWARGQAFLECDYSIIGGAMSWVSEANLVAAISNAGGFGVIASGAVPPKILSTEIQKTRALTNKKFGVNLITLNPQINLLIDVCIKEKIEYVILAGGLPNKSHIQTLKENNIKVISFAPVLTLAKKMIKMGADALIIEGMEAGGHIGPVSTSILAQEILPEISEVPIFIAGGIGEGRLMASYLMMGASGVQIGTKFVCAKESMAHKNFKKVFINAHARDAVASIQLDSKFPVIPVRAIKNKATDDFIEKQKSVLTAYKAGQISLEEGMLEIECFWAGRLRAAVIDGDIENGSLMAGQTVGLVKSIQPVKEIIKELCESGEYYLISHRG